MDSSLPDAIQLEYALNPQIQITFTKFKKIIFRSPPELRGRTVNNLFEASFVVRNAPSFPYSDWIVTDVPQSWTPWSYEHDVSKALKRGPPLDLPDDWKQQVLGSVSGPGDKGSTCPDPHTMPPSTWTSALVSSWITQGGHPPLILDKITHFRRYGSGLSFEFLCQWKTTGPRPEPVPVWTWQKYTDLQHVADYAQYLRRHWNAAVERERNWEDELERVKGTLDDIQLPETTGQAYAIEPTALKAQRRWDKEERSKKRHRKAKPSGVDSDSEPSEAESSDSDSAAEEPAPPPPTSQPLPPEQPGVVEWLDIFDQSAVFPPSRYKVKVFPGA